MAIVENKSRVLPYTDAVQQNKETLSSTGKLIVISGLSGAGKDSVIDEVLTRNNSYRRLITCADRSPRDNEEHGIHYYFVTPQTLDEMHIKGELVEAPLRYGSSRKATPKNEFTKVLYEGQNVIWRIDPSLAAKIASGDFFDSQFDAEESRLLREVTKVIFITAPQETLELRRATRDGNSYDPADYSVRDEQDRLVLEFFRNSFSHIVVNEQGRLSQTVEEVITIIDM